VLSRLLCESIDDPAVLADAHLATNTALRNSTVGPELEMTASLIDNRCINMSSAYTDADRPEFESEHEALRRPTDDPFVRHPCVFRFPHRSDLLALGNGLHHLAES